MISYLDVHERVYRLELSLVFHAPLELNLNVLPNQVQQEWPRINRVQLQKNEDL